MEDVLHTSSAAHSFLSAPEANSCPPDLSDSLIKELATEILLMKVKNPDPTKIEIYWADAIRRGSDIRAPVLHLHKVASELEQGTSSVDHGEDLNKVIIQTTIAVQRLASTPIKDPFHETCKNFVLIASIINAIAIYLLPVSVILSFNPYTCLAAMLIVPVLSIAYVIFHPNKDKVTEEVHDLAVKNLANYLYLLKTDDRDAFIKDATSIGRLSQHTAYKLFASLKPSSASSQEFPDSLL